MMTWTEFTTGLRHVAGHGTTQGLALDTRASLYGLSMIAGGDAEPGGVYLTETGRKWLARVNDQTNARVLEAYAAALDRLLPGPDTKGEYRGHD